MIGIAGSQVVFRTFQKVFWGRGMTGTRAPLKIVPPSSEITTARKAGNAPVDSTAHPKPKLLDQLREALRSRHYSRRTEQTYCHWVKRYIFFHNVRHPAEMAEPEINQFLTHLAVKEHVSASTQHLQRVRMIHEKDLSGGYGRVLMPNAMDRKYPNSPAEWRWQWVFPQENHWINTQTGQEGRHHVDASILQKAF